MKVLNVAVRDTPVGLVAVLPDSVGWALDDPYRTDPVAVGDVLGVVTKCETCNGTAWSCIVETDEGDFMEDTCPDCDGAGYAPLTFVKVLAVAEIAAYIVGATDGRYTVARLGQEWVHLPDAEPGGVALHVEWTDCPTCGGIGRTSRWVLHEHTDNIHTVTPVDDDRSCRCQHPFAPPSDAPIVEVK